MSVASVVRAAEPIIDSDNDGLSDAVEEQLGTDSFSNDTDGDKYPDGIEVANGYNPLLGERDRSLQRYVEVDLNTQQLTYFMDNVKVGAVPVSTGILGKETPVGTFAIFRKLPVHRYVGVGYDLPNTKWNLEFKNGFYLHGAYWHNQFGIRPMSHGCVNISTKNAEKIYKFMDIGDEVRISGKTPANVKIAGKKK